MILLQYRAILVVGAPSNGYLPDSVASETDMVSFEQVVLDFISKRAGRTHHFKINQYHYQDSVALIGDSAHVMNSLLGQEYAAGLESTHTLVECLVVEIKRRQSTRPIKVLTARH